MTRTIVVTGSASGIGQATARLLQGAGHTVIGVDIQEGDVVADLSQAEGRAHAVAEVVARCGGKLDALIACAGLASADLRGMVAVNYFGAVAMAAGLRSNLQQSDAARVVMIASSAAILPSHPPLVEACLAGDEDGAIRAATDNDVLTYASTKLALSRWIRRTAILPEWAGSGILLNGIAPGTVRTPMTAPLLATAEGQAILAEATPIVLEDWARPEDIASFAAFLAGPECRYLVGQTIFVDGGTEVIRRGEQCI